MALILRPPWDVQPLELPRVNVAHPLASILVDAWVGSFPQITSDTVTAPSGIGSAVSGRGVGSTFGAYASTSIVSLPNTDRSRLVGVNGSIVAGIKFGTVASDTFPHIWAVRDATTQIALLSGGLNASTYSGGRIAFSAGGVDTISTASSLRQNAYAVYGAEWGTNGRKLFVDGSLDTTAASTAVVAATSIRPSLGNRQSGGRSLGSGSELYFCLTFSQNIGDKWHRKLAHDPYQLFERRIWVPVSAGGGTNNTLTGDSGSYAYTGNAAAFQVTRALDGAVGSYTLIGNTGTFSYIPGAGSIPYTLSGATGAYAYTGNAATFRVGHSLSGATGAYAYSGNAATFKVGHTLPGAAGAYAFTGRDGTFAYVGSTAYALSGDSGSYSIAGTEGAFAFSGAAKPVGGYDEARKRKRFVVKVGDKLVEYGSASAAAKALNKAPEAKPEPVAEVPIRKIKAQARVFKAEQQVQNLFKQQDFEAMLALYEQMQDEDDIETLLMLV